jgi:Trypsin-like peptidase domain
VDNRTLLATALHLIGEDGGVEPKVPLASFDSQLISWSASVRTRATPNVRAISLAMSSTNESDASDWLLLNTAALGAGQLPATPLRLRDVPVGLGERISLVGCEYKVEACTQGVISGRVTGRSGRSFRYELDQPTELRGFSGAPIVDVAGRVVGVMSLWFTPFQIGESQLEGGGKDASVALSLVGSEH